MSNNFPNDAAIVSGYSMYPLLKSGDVVRLRPVSRSDIRRGDILTFCSAKNCNIIHRVISVNPLQTMGENNAKMDNPVPVDCPLHIAISVLRNGNEKPLRQGPGGWREFRFHRVMWHIRRHTWNFPRRFLGCIAHRLAQFIPGRIPFSSLQCTRFPNKDVYYHGNKPVGWVDSNGWHWTHLSWLRVKEPNQRDLNLNP